MTKFINRKYITKCIELILYLLHYWIFTKISYQSYFKIESHIDYSIFNELSYFLFVLNYITCFLILSYGSDTLSEHLFVKPLYSAQRMNYSDKVACVIILIQPIKLNLKFILFIYLNCIIN